MSWRKNIFTQVKECNSSGTHPNPFTRCDATDSAPRLSTLLFEEPS